MPCHHGCANHDYTGEWEVPEELTVCSFAGNVKIDFTEAKWGGGPEKKINLNVRSIIGNITIIVPEDVKVDTTCAGCCTGWVWCGGYMGDPDCEKSIVLCEYAWFGCVHVERPKPKEEDKKEPKSITTDDQVPKEDEENKEEKKDEGEEEKNDDEKDAAEK
eukprot:m.37322 g.37322  ORF g.37322 m.37322 type:complete len:161 (+) comp9298_c0_seq1:140-622(+)